MPDYEFSLNINNESETITRRSGFNIYSLGSLLSGLSRATNPGDNSPCALDRVDNHGYTPHFVTNSFDRYRSFVNVHRKIVSVTMNELSADERYYAKILKRVLSGGKHLEAYNNENQIINRIDPAQIGNGKAESYHIIKTVEGVIRQIGGKNLTRGTHIMLNGVPYKIMTSAQQDTSLGPFYKDTKLSLRVKQKCSLEDGHVLYAVLLSFRVHSKLTLIEGVEQLEGVSFISESDSF